MPDILVIGEHNGTPYYTLISMATIRKQWQILVGYGETWIFSHVWWGMEYRANELKNSVVETKNVNHKVTDSITQKFHT